MPLLFAMTLEALRPWSPSLSCRTLRCLLSSVVWLLCSAGLTVPMGQVSQAQYIDENRRLKDFTKADYVSEEKPKWIGPYNWFWVPDRRYDYKILSSPNNWIDKYDSMDMHTCLLLKDRTAKPSNWNKMYYCKPPLKDNSWWIKKIVADDTKADSSDRYSHVNIGPEEQWPGSEGESFVASSEPGGGYGEVTFAWNWRKHIVHTKLCDSTRVSEKSQQEIVEAGNLTSRGQDELLSAKPIQPEDINVDVHICRDNPQKKEPDKFAPYETFKEMDMANQKCILNLVEDHDGGHAPKGDYKWTWRKSVPEGWFMGQNASFGKDKFMEWCLKGGTNPFDKKPYPGPKKGEYDARKVTSGGNFGDFGKGDYESPWEAAEDYAGSLSGGLYAKKGGTLPVGADSLIDRAQRQCRQLFRDIVGRRKKAFLELCKKEPYDHFDGCSDRLKKCRGYRNDEGIDVGVNQCCTDSHPQYHYHQRKTYTVPCQPVDAFTWENVKCSPTNPLCRDQWKSHRGWDADKGGYKRVVKKAEWDRGFVGSNSILAPVGGDGEPMDVTSDVKIGSYFWFDLLSGTIGIRTWDERAYSQTVSLPATHKQANESDYWKWGNWIRGSKDWGWFPPGWRYDDISPQRGREDPVGWLYHLYFCKETFSRDELKLMQKKWGTVSAELEEAADKSCPKGEAYRWSDKAGDYKCVAVKEDPDPDPDPPKKKQSWCALCYVDPTKNSGCPEKEYQPWRAISPPKAFSMLPEKNPSVSQVRCKTKWGKNKDNPPPYRAWSKPPSSGL